MDIIDNLTKTLSKTASEVGKKTGEAVNRGKIRFALANLQSDLDELYEKLGKMRYEEMSTGKIDIEEEEDVVSKIDSIKTDMEILKAELISKCVNICPGCGKTVKKNTPFCPYCGKKTD